MVSCNVIRCCQNKPTLLSASLVNQIKKLIIKFMTFHFFIRVPTILKSLSILLHSSERILFTLEWLFTIYSIRVHIRGFSQFFLVHLIIKDEFKLSSSQLEVEPEFKFTLKLFYFNSFKRVEIEFKPKINFVFSLILYLNKKWLK